VLAESGTIRIAPEVLFRILVSYKDSKILPPPFSNLKAQFADNNNALFFYHAINR
jgi:hypothetical protein